MDPFASTDVVDSRARRLRAATREAQALARVAALWPCDLTAVFPASAAAGDDVVVLVHGALATAGAWRPLRERPSREHVHTATFTYAPGCGVTDIARALRGVLGRLPAHVRIHLVGHSLGGLAVRWFVQETPGDQRVEQTISVAAPFQGARGARLLPGPAGRDMRRGSAVLQRLSASAAGSPVPHLSILGTADTAVAVDTRFPVGERQVVSDAGHNVLLFHEDVAACILRRVREARG